METKKVENAANGLVQLKRYAQDLNEVYKSEKKKRKELHVANQQLVKFASDLNRTIVELKGAHRQLQEAYLDTIHRLALAAEYKDEDTGDHINRMSQYSALIAEKYGLPPIDVQNILYASPMHDVGKIGVPDNILTKTGKLSEEEFDLIKTHTVIGANILDNSKSDILKIACRIARYHHEKWNGRGYPEGLSGTDIPIDARIVGLVDVFDALTSSRPYKNPYPVDVATDIIEKERGQHFDPDLVDVFLDNFDKILEIKQCVSAGDDICLAAFNFSERDGKDGILLSLSDNK